MKKILFDNNKNVVSATIKNLRQQHNMTQDQLAARMQTMGVNIDQQMISRIENNRRFVTDYELACFSRIFHIPVADLLMEFYRKYTDA